ncbi:MAG: murein DD-endopeptidase MepM/ murein hydrolase activator NlpD [Bacteroidia bacterium]|jgi:murein DD-endopeptidase MepM/ murein hydrolase activator NlpD
MKVSRIKEFVTKKLRNRYRLIIRNDLNLEERISMVLTPLNVVLLLSGLLVVFTAIAIFLLPITPLRYLMPGGGDINPRDFTVMKNRLDSIERTMELRDQRDSNLYRILMSVDTLPSSYQMHQPDDANSSGWTFFPTASAGASQVTGAKNKSDNKDNKESLPLKRVYSFYTPLKGIITDTFNLRTKHVAIDISSYPNAAVKATLDGTVVLSSWTPETGHIMLLQHTDNFISVYKHNAVLLKKQGARVRVGEVIALMGNSGELTSGPHLHFELWHNGQAVNPADYIKF